MITLNINNMGSKTFFGWLIRMPLILLNLATLGVSIYAAMGKVPGFFISWGATGLIGSLLLAYIIGSFMISSDKDNEEEAEEVQAEVPEQLQ